ncbi:tail protein [Marinomonas phage P12026]|uniref:tail protein n=1 Tax=Marinomonas phage P12026 TaxID=1176423 RepID=UPI0002688F3E|nr:tail protein [Marinomonas phage P12026]AFM54866.1 hypothetical protein P12026_20 [Marinomonas phage P12026]
MALPIFQRTVTNSAGDVIEGAQVSVFDESTGLLSTIYSNREGTAALSNPFLTGSDGLASFYAQQGEYRISVSSVAGSVTWRYQPLIGTLDEGAAVLQAGIYAQESAGYANTAIDARDVAIGAANYKGDWTVSTNVLQGESYSYSGSTWIAKQNSVGQTPAVGVYWLKGVGTAAFLNVGTTPNDIPTVSTLVSSRSALLKTDRNTVAFEVSGADVLASQDFSYSTDGSIFEILSGEVVTLPTLASASDYKIYGLSDGSLSAQLFDTARPTGGVLIGGFHVYHTTGGINPNSLWDINFRPKCNPRAMTLSPDRRVWADIYLMDVEYGLNGYSRSDVTIADGASPPIVPAIYGGNGVTTYGSLTWFEAWDLVINAGKRLAFWGEFSGLAYGVVEQQSFGTDPVTTKYQAGHRSAIGLEQATGVMWIWGADTQGSSGSAAAITDGRGSVYSGDPRSVLLGAGWNDGVAAGSRSASWNASTGGSDGGISVRAVCDHLIL